MKRIMTIVALMCAVAFQANAQNEVVEKALKDAEKKVRLADKHPKNGKMQLEAATAFINDELGDKKDFDRAMIYAERALKIAEEQTVLKDTLLGLSYYNLTMIYMAKTDWPNIFNYGEKTMDAFEKELGRYSPLTNGTKLIFGMLMMGAEPVRAFPWIQEAFYDNSLAPEDQRIENMDEANILQELALEFLIADHTKRFRYALPSIPSEGKKLVIVQNDDWNMESPLVGWMVPGLTESDAKEETSKGNDVLLCDENFKITVLPQSEKGKLNLNFNFRQKINFPRQLESNEGDARLWFMTPEGYDKILTAYREFKKEKK